MAAAGTDVEFPSVNWLPGSSNIAVADFPLPTKVTSVDTKAEAALVLSAINRAIAKPDYKEIAKLFTKNGYWRDHLILSWEFRTVKGNDSILNFLQNCSKSKDGFRLKSITLDVSSPSRQPTLTAIDGEAKVAGIHAFFGIETTIGNGEGTMRLALEDDKWKIFTFYTSLRQLKGHEEAIFDRRPRGVEHGQQPGRRNWKDRRMAEVELSDGEEPAVLIVGKAGVKPIDSLKLTRPGAGQAGLTAAARLKMLGIPALIVEQNEHVGDSWRKRYHQLVLHDPVWYDHLPYMSFPPQWPVFTPKDKLAQFFQAYADLMELNIWLQSEIAEAEWDEDKEAWTVTIKRKLSDGSIHTRALHPRHIIQATGHSGKKNQPLINGLDGFMGDLLCHSADFSGARRGAVGKKAVIVGCCNSAHDIAQDYVENGYDVTMVQRSSTNVVSSKSILDIALKGIYAEDGPPVDDADMLVHGLPNSVLKAVQITVTALQKESDKDILNGLEKAGFKVDHGPDESGLFFKYFQRGGGYYIDVGASKLIADGSIKIKRGQVSEILPHGIRFSDGSDLAADEIVFATGYQNMQTETRRIFGDAVAGRVNDVWGLNDEGEWRTIWQKSGHPGFWLHGGNLALCRYYSRLLALQIKGQEEGIYKYSDI